MWKPPFKTFDGQFRDDYHNLCLILLVYSGDSKPDFLRKIGIDHIENNMVRCRQSARTLVVAQVDPVTGMGQFLDIGKGHGLCLYSYGCKMLKKLFG